MQRAYGKEVTKKDEVTLVFFRVVTLPGYIKVVNLNTDNSWPGECGETEV